MVTLKSTTTAAPARPIPSQTAPATTPSQDLALIRKQETPAEMYSRVENSDPEDYPPGLRAIGERMLARRHEAEKLALEAKS